MFNSIEYATAFQNELDKAMLAESCTGWMESNTGMLKYLGGADVKIPSLVLQGLAAAQPIDEQHAGDPHAGAGEESPPKRLPVIVPAYRGKGDDTRLGQNAQGTQRQQKQAEKEGAAILRLQFFSVFFHVYSSKSEKSNTSSMVSPK